MRILLVHPDAHAPAGVLRAHDASALPKSGINAIVGVRGDPLVELARRTAPAADVAEIDRADDVEAALCEAERRVWRTRHERAGHETQEASGRRVVLVGAGIVNLLVAWRLAEAGCRVVLLDAASDPRLGTGLATQGTTHGGHDARMCSLTEATVRVPAEGTADPWSRPVSDGGWLSRPVDELAPATRAWTRRAGTTPPWLARGFADDVHALNTAGTRLWADVRAKHPDLFVDANATDRVVHVFPSEVAMRTLHACHTAIGDQPRLLSVEELRRVHPALRDAPTLVGGFEGAGFTLQLHRFVRALLGALADRGVECRWGSRLVGVRRDRDGAVLGVATTAGDVVADDYVLSLGADTSSALAGFRTAGAVRGVLGLWAELDAADTDAGSSIKAHLGGPVADCVNIIPAVRADGSRCMILGAGYMLIERDEDRFGAEAAELRRVLDRRVSQLFPKRVNRSPSSHPSHCVRPFSATGLGLFESIPTVAGGACIVAGGHCTGGFAQAPAVAEAVLARVEGRAHPMHWLCDPQRGGDPLAEPVVPSPA